MTRLETMRVSLASADQRRGRAGRLGPGVCYRLLGRARDALACSPRTPPEIASADLAPLALSLAAAGVDDPGELSWLDPPAPARVRAGARAAARARGARRRGVVSPLKAARWRSCRCIRVFRICSSRHRDTRRGARPRRSPRCCPNATCSAPPAARSMPTSPCASISSCAPMTAARCPLGPSSIATRCAAYAYRIRSSARSHRRQRRDQRATELSPGHLLALAYPDRVAQRRPGDAPRFVLRNGRGAELLGAQSLADVAVHRCRGAR